MNKNKKRRMGSLNSLPPFGVGRLAPSIRRGPLYNESLSMSFAY